MDVSIDLFGPLPTTTEGYKNIFIVENITGRWVELFAICKATAETCANELLDDFNYNGTQFVSAVIQKLKFCLKIEHTPSRSEASRTQKSKLETATRNTSWQQTLELGRKITSDTFCNEHISIKQWLYGSFPCRDFLMIFKII